MNADDGPATREELSPQPVFDMLWGFQTTAIVRAAVHLGLFDALAAGAERAQDVATRLNLDERGTRILLEGLAALGLVEVQDEGYRLSDLADAFLVRGRPSYMGKTADVLVNEWQWEAHWHLPEAVRGGGAVIEEHAETPNHPFWETFATSISALAVPAAAAISEILDPWASRATPLRVLDVASGNGIYSFTLAERQGHAELTLVDWPNVLAITRQIAAEKGLSNRVTFREGNMFDTGLGGPYELAITSHVFHHFSEGRCNALLGRLRESLAPGGRLAIHDFLATDLPPPDDPFPRLFSVLMLVWTPEGEAYSHGDYERMLEANGFGGPELHELEGLPSRLLVTQRVD